MTNIPLSRGLGFRGRILSPPRTTSFGTRLEDILGKFRYLIAHPGFRRSPALTLARLFRWWLQCAFGIPANFSIPEWDARFYLPPRWNGAGTTMFYALRSGYENELLHLGRFIPPGVTVVDGGASCGAYTVAAAKLVGPSGLVLSFEPAAEAFSVLDKNIELNGLQNVRAYRAALSEKEGKAALFHHTHGPNSFSLGPSGAETSEFEEVATLTLSKVAQQAGIRIGLIKLDVEGAEELVLREAEQLIANSRPVIVFEVNPIQARRLGLNSAGAWRLLETLGYAFFSLSERGHLCPINHLPTGDEVFNVLAIHTKEMK